MACQSGRSAAGLASALAIAAAPASLAGPTGWAHQAAGFQSNGAVTVKSLAGGSYSGTQNPTGAVAKANQSAATQAPTVIIQATSGGARECQPKLVQTNTMPSCSAGYTSVFQAAGQGCPAPGSSTFNIAGTNWSFGHVAVQNAAGVGFMNDNKPESAGKASADALATNCQYVSTSYQWSANLCCK